MSSSSKDRREAKGYRYAGGETRLKPVVRQTSGGVRLLEAAIPVERSEYRGDVSILEIAEERDRRIAEHRERIGKFIPLPAVELKCATCSACGRRFEMAPGTLLKTCSARCGQLRTSETLKRRKRCPTSST